MFDAHKQNPEQRFIAEGKNEREKSVTAVVYDTFSRAWGKKAWDDVTYGQLEVVFRAVFDHSSNELGIEAMPHKLEAEYKTQLIAAIMDQISVIVPDIEEDQWGDVFEHFAKSVPEEQETILRQALLVLKPSEEQKWNRMKIVRTLIDLDPMFFVQLSSFGFTRKDELNIARRVSEKNGQNIFAFIDSVGVLTPEFQEAVFAQFSLGLEWYIDYKKPSPEEAVELIRRVDVSRQEHLRESLSIPPRTFGLERKIFSMLENEYKKSFPIHVEEMHALGIV